MASGTEADWPRDDQPYREQKFQVRNFEGGLSAAPLATHLELHRGYVAQTNAFSGALAVTVR